MRWGVWQDSVRQLQYGHSKPTISLYLGLAEEAVARLERLQEACDAERRRAEAAEAAVAEQEAAAAEARRQGDAEVERAQAQVCARLKFDKWINLNIPVLSWRSRMQPQSS